jgi:hypothetical protein
MTSGRDITMEKWDDEAILSVSKEIDDFFVEQSLKYEMSANAINGVFMARLLRMNQSVGNMDSLYKLLESILTRDHEQLDDEQSIH